MKYREELNKQKFIMKNKGLVIFLFILFGLAIPVALLGCFMTLLWFIGSLVKDSSALEIAMAFLGNLIGATYIVTYVISLHLTFKNKKISFKTFLPAVHCLIALLFLLSLSPVSKYISNSTERFGFAKKDFTVIQEVNTHGGFHGDGYYYLALDCSDNKEKARKELETWHKFPLPEVFDGILFCSSADDNAWIEEADIPVIKNGYYMFEDRAYESTDSSDYSQLRKRPSYNFTLAVYDSDNDIMYYLEYDT